MFSWFSTLCCSHCYVKYVVDIIVDSSIVGGDGGDSNSTVDDNIGEVT